MVTRAKRKERKRRSGLTENKAPLLKYTNYHSLTTPMNHIYTVTDRSLYRQLEAMKGDRSCRDIKKNCAFHKDIGHNTERCVTLKDAIERLIRVGHFNKFMDEPQMTNREERPHQRSPNKINEVLTIISGSHIARESRNARDKYTKKAKTSQNTCA